MANLLTNLLFEPKGTHDPTKAYTIKDTVMSADGSKVYFALKNVPIGIQLNNTEYWICQMNLSATKAAMDAAAAEANAAANNANTAADNGVRTDVSQGLNETQKATARQNIGMDEIIESLSDPLNASGNPLAVKPVGGMPFESVVTKFSPKQAGSGDPSPENIRPISGWDSVNLNAAGKNLLPNNAVSITKNGLTYTVNNDGSVTVNGTCDSSSFFTICGSVELPQGEYILSGNPQGITYSKVRLYVDKYDSMTESHKFTLAAAQALTVNIVVYTGVVLNNAVFKPMIRSASDPDATYEPYQHKFHTVQIGQTVYGGKLDWTTGKLVAEWAMVTLTSNLNWVKSGSAKNGFYLADGNVFVPAKLPYCPVVCNVARYVAKVEDYRANYGTIYSDSTVSLSINPAVCGDTLDSFENWLDSTPVQIAYKLAAPIEIQLDPTEIIALPGVNTLYGDGDTITVTGRQPKTNALETRLAALEAAITNV